MLNLKKTAVAVLAFGSSAVFAGTMGPVCAPGNVTVPCASQAWDFGVQALYLKPSYSAFQYNRSLTTVNNQVDDLLVTNTDYQSLPNNWAWGFKLEGSYHFSTGNDLNLNWYHLDHTVNNAYINVPVGDVINGVVLESIDALGTSTTTKWDAVNLEFGQHAHFGEWKNIRFHGGVQYARIQNTIDADAAGVTFGAVDFPNVAFDGQVTSKFNGFGPRIGADYLYNWGNGFAMYANGATALLVGTQSFNTSAALVANVDQDIETAVALTNGSATAVVPALEAKLGVKYTYAMAQGDLSLDAGWMWANYFNAVNAGPTVAPFQTVQSNFAVQGPFLGLKWIGNVA